MRQLQQQLWQEIHECLHMPQGKGKERGRAMQLLQQVRLLLEVQDGSVLQL